MMKFALAGLFVAGSIAAAAAMPMSKPVTNQPLSVEKVVVVVKKVVRRRPVVVVRKPVRRVVRKTIIR